MREKLEETEIRERRDTESETGEGDSVKRGERERETIRDGRQTKSEQVRREIENYERQQLRDKGGGRLPGCCYSTHTVLLPPVFGTLELALDGGEPTSKQPEPGQQCLYHLLTQQPEPQEAHPGSKQGPCLWEERQCAQEGSQPSRAHPRLAS